MSDSMLEERRPFYDFDYIGGADVLEDVHAAYLNLKKNAPPLFWTPHNGGHWVANDADLVSSLITIDFEGHKLTFDELMSIGFLMFLAGLDTVTNALTFGMRHLTHDPALQQRMADDPDCIPQAVEELLRLGNHMETHMPAGPDGDLTLRGQTQ